MTDMDFPNRLHELRIRRELSMDMLTIDLNNKYGLRLNKGTISRWESGQGDPAISYVKCLADYFNVSVDYLIGLTDVQTPARLLAYNRKIMQEVASPEMRKERARRLIEEFSRKEDS